MKVLKAPNMTDTLAIIEKHWHKTPWFSSPKVDGNRSFLFGERFFTASGKAPRNVHVRRVWHKLREFLEKQHLCLDGELYAPSCSHHAELSGILNSYDQALPRDLCFYAFDCMSKEQYRAQCISVPYSGRLVLLEEVARNIHIALPELCNGDSPRFQVLRQTLLTSPAHAKELYDQHIEEGYEGSIIRAGQIWRDGSFLRGGFYKHGRATTTQRTMYKLKALETADAYIVAAVERRCIRDDTARKRVSGRLVHPTTKDSFVGADTLGSFIVRVPEGDDIHGPYTECEVMFGRGFDLQWRRDMWQKLKDPAWAAANLLGKWVEVSHMGHGSLEGGKLRHGRLMRFREDIPQVDPVPAMPSPYLILHSEAPNTDMST